MTLSAAPRVIVGCSADSNPKYVAQALRLMQSIRWFGGSLANAHAVFCAVNKGELFDDSVFVKLDVEVRAVAPFPSGNPYANKLQFFERDFSGYDLAILLDGDTVVVQDPMPYVTPGVFLAKTVDRPTTPNDVLVRLCRAYRLPVPDPVYRTTIDLVPTMWHVNSGVIILPVEFIPVLIPRWRYYESELANQRQLMGNSWGHRNQASLTLAYLETRVPFDELPPAMNFSLNSTSSRYCHHLADVDPVILHYHRFHHTDGRLRSSPYEGVQARIHDYNLRLTFSGETDAMPPVARDPGFSSREIQFAALRAHCDILQRELDLLRGSAELQTAMKIAGRLKTISRMAASAARRLGLTK